MKNWDNKILADKIRCHIVTCQLSLYVTFEFSLKLIVFQIFCLEMFLETDTQFSNRIVFLNSRFLKIYISCKYLILNCLVKHLNHLIILHSIIPTGLKKRIHFFVTVFIKDFMNYCNNITSVQYLKYFFMNLTGPEKDVHVQQPDLPATHLTKGITSAT